MLRRILGTRLLRASLAATLAGASTARSETPTLSALLPTGKAVPACAKLLLPKAGSDGPCGATSNPHVSRDPGFVTCMATMLLRIGATERVKPQQASEAAFVTYQSGAEMGLLAVAFDETRAASDLAASLEQALAAEPSPRPGALPRAAILRSGNAVGFAACDSMFDDACCEQMLAHLRGVWKKP